MAGEQEFIEADVALRDQELAESHRKRRRRAALSAALMGLIGILIGSGLFQYLQAQKSKARLAETLAAQKTEAQRAELSGALTVFGTSYGREANEINKRGLFTSMLEKHLFHEYVSVSHAVGLAESDIVSVSEGRRRAEVLSSMNGEVFFSPRNETRRSLALIVGSDDYSPPWPHLEGAVADAQSIDSGVRRAGYSSRFLANPTADDVRKALTQLLNDAAQGCKTQNANRTQPGPIRGLRPDFVKDIKPCANMLVFVYFAGHGFANGGNTYLVMKDVVTPNDLSALSASPSVLSLEEVRGKIAERVAAQIIIADISRGLVSR